MERNQVLFGMASLAATMVTAAALNSLPRNAHGSSAAPILLGANDPLVTGGPISVRATPAPTLDHSVGQPSTSDDGTIALAAAIPAVVGVDPDTEVTLVKRSGLYYDFKITSREGGGGFNAIVSKTAGGPQSLMNLQDYPDCSEEGLSPIPVELVSYCYTVGINAALVHRLTGTLAPE